MLHPISDYLGASLSVGLTLMKMVNILPLASNTRNKIFDQTTSFLDRKALSFNTYSHLLFEEFSKAPPELKFKPKKTAGNLKRSSLMN